MTAMGVFWGIFMLIVLMGVGLGLERTFVRVFGGMSTNAAYLFPDQTSVPYKGMPTGRWWRMSMADARDLKKLVPEVQYASGTIWGSMYTFSRADKKGDYQIMGYSPEYQKINPAEIIYGRYINEIDMAEKRKSCLIGPQVWKDLFPEGGDPSGKVIKMNGIYLTVVGVVDSGNMGVTFSDSDNTVIVPITLAQQLYNYGDRVHMVTAMGYDWADPFTLEQECRKVIAANHIISPDDPKAIGSFNTGEEFTRVKKLLGGVNLLTWIVGIGTMLAGIIGVSNIMLIAVKERTREIGVRRALGATPMMIISQILSESFLLTFMAGVFGLTLGVGLLSIADTLIGMITDLNISVQISFWLGMGALGIIIAGSLLAGVIPANRAIQIKAVDAIRDE